MESADGLVLLFARLRDPMIRDAFWSHFQELPGERVGSAIYQLSTADWDEGLWQEEIDWIGDLLAGSQDRVVVWQFQDA